MEVHGFIPNLQRHLAGCDVALVPGGPSTCMELTAHRRTLLYFPLRNHFEQTYHVRHRLERYRAGRCVDHETATPDVLGAAAIVEELNRTLDDRPVESDGAKRAASLLAELV